MKKRNNYPYLMMGTGMGLLTDLLGRKRVNKMRKMRQQTMHNTKEAVSKVGEIASDWGEKLTNRLK